MPKQTENTQEPFGICPYMSHSIPVTSAVASPVATPNTIDVRNLKAIVLRAPCVGPDCQLWDEKRLCCGLKADTARTDLVIQQLHALTR
jgi:hypothetical protein